MLQHPFRPADVVSCYTTNLGPWDPPVRGPGSEFWEIPQTVRLTNTPLEGFVGSFKIEPVVYDESITRRWGSWELQGNTLRVLWLDGFTGVSADLKASNGGLSGIAETHEDGNAGYHRRASLALEPTPCR
jgi:hypothetical protein